MGAPFSYSNLKNPVVFQWIPTVYLRTGNQMGHQNSTYLKTRSGIYYFTRRIPNDLQKAYGLDRIYVSLRTRSRRQATASSVRISSELAASWNLKRSECIVRKLCVNGNAVDPTHQLTVSVLPPNTASLLPLLSEATEIYLSLKGRDRSVNFESSVHRSIRYLIEQLGDKAIDSYKRTDALFLRDRLLERQLSTSSIKRNFNNINAVVGLVAKELGFAAPTQFRSLFFKDVAGPSKRLSVPSPLLRQLQSSCLHVDDEARWVLALISDTGMRLSEAVGLTRADVDLTGDVPNVTVRPHPWRRLKTIDSKRMLPLIGSALWSVERALSESNSPYLFPNMCDGKSVKSNSVSATLNKWLKKQIGGQYVVHSLRHSFRDRLRSVECPSEVADALGGWSQKTIGQSYGSGYDIGALNKWMKLIELNKMDEEGTNASP